MWKFYVLITLEGIAIYVWCRLIKWLDERTKTRESGNNSDS